MAKKGSRMAGDAVADNDEAKGAINRAASKNSGGIDYQYGKLDELERRHTAARDKFGDGDLSDLDAQGKQFYINRLNSHKRQRAARDGMKEAGWDGDINTYDFAAFGTKRIDDGDIEFLKNNGVTEDQIQGYLKG